MQVAPHRRIAVTFEVPDCPNRYTLICQVSDWFQHFGYVRVRTKLFDLLGSGHIRMLTESIGLDSIVDTYPSSMDRARADLARAIDTGATHAVFPSMFGEVAKDPPGEIKVLARIDEPPLFSMRRADMVHMEAEAALDSGFSGLVVPGSFIEDVKRRFECPVAADEGCDPHKAAGDGADVIFMPNSVLRAEDPVAELRGVAFRIPPCHVT